MDDLDWILKYIAKPIAIITFSLFLFALIGAFFAAYRVGQLQEQCVADGLKEYECYSILHARK